MIDVMITNCQLRNQKKTPSLSKRSFQVEKNELFTFSNQL